MAIMYSFLTGAGMVGVMRASTARANDRRLITPFLVSVPLSRVRRASRGVNRSRGVLYLRIARGGTSVETGTSREVGAPLRLFAKLPEHLLGLSGGNTSCRSLFFLSDTPFVEP